MIYAIGTIDSFKSYAGVPPVSYFLFAYIRVVQKVTFLVSLEYSSSRRDLEI